MMTSQSIRTSGSTLRQTTTYKYTPLALSSTQFRVFTLRSSSDKEASLEGTLRVEAFLGKDGGTCPYEALSYVWGDQEDAVPLFIEGGTQIMITKNLAQALRHIRLPSQPRDVWIDALCIDQSNALEKNHQVRQMYTTFASASRVVIWLGLADSNSEYALNHLDSLRTASRRNMACIASIFKRPWASRMWTFQEGLAANASSIVMCGATTVSWQKVLHALKDLLDRATSFSDTSIHRLRYFLEVHTLHKTSKRLTLDKLIMASSDRRATDPRDYIFALLGLVNDGQCEEIEPDYAQPASVIFQKAVINICKSRNNLNLLVSSLTYWEPPKWCNLDEIIWGCWSLPAMQRQAFLDLDDHYLNRRWGVMHGGAADGRALTGVLHGIQQGTITLTGTIVGTIRECIWLYTPKGWLNTTDRVWHDDIASATWKVTPGKYVSRDIFQFHSSEKRSVGHRLREVIFAILSTQIHKVTATAREQWNQTSPQHATTKIQAGHVWKLLANGLHMEHFLNERPCSDEAYSELPLLETTAADWFAQVLLRHRFVPPLVDGKTNFSRRERDKMHGDFAEWLNQTHNPNTRNERDSELKAAGIALYRIAADISEGLNIFTVSGGYIGSSYANIAPGDVLCILFGSKVPFVLRKDSADYYRIVDAVYVDGLMGGEYFKSGNKRTLTEFIIK